MRIRTIPKIVKEIRSFDPSSVVGELFLMTLVESNELPHTYHGNRLVIDADAVVPTLNRLLGFESREELPHIRSIRGAAEELKQIHPEMGVGEKHIRNVVKDGRISNIRVGNRVYIALENFEEPYCTNIFDLTPVKISHREAIHRDTMEQVAQAIASNPFIPTVKRIRRSE